jgi:hypothetical protein
LLKDKKYKYNQTLIKRFANGTDTRYKVVTCKCLRTSGVEDDSDKGRIKNLEGEKLAESISRTRSRIYELAFCNEWDWFFTATLDPLKYVRSDLEKFHKNLTQWIRNYNRLHKTTIKFLLIPELHSDGVSWHMHGLLHGLPVEHLQLFQIGDRMGKKLAEKVKNGDIVYNWIPYANKFGFCDAEPIRSHEAVCKYITKYISKSLNNSVKELNAHMYYCSRGLNRAETIKKGTMSANIVPDYENEYCAITWVDDEQVIQTILNSII